ncbi:carbonic anhydrase [Actinomadura viridis]|uniref:carbonic anhydrase n=1 Tax=Actinomadura viridis TaxID=58110 RepID=A0A931DLU9_9ACTN|nr:carbonic anhydrase [Actinomadura viridis]MBG6089445.1 carbonic anhydrase [Actinomadura viridis]
MRSFVEHARSFRARMAADGQSLAPLAHGQSPLALFITCSDSRVIPALITGARPGELFELRTAGGIVPHYNLDRPSGEAATIEFAVEVLCVADIVVCGHSQCAAVAARVRGDDLSQVPAMDGWLTHAAGAPRPAPAPTPPGTGHHGTAPRDPAAHTPATAHDTTQDTAQDGAQDGAPDSAVYAGTSADRHLTAAIHAHVLAQLDRLRHYPCISTRLDQGRIGLHGWFYEVHTGTVLAHRPADGTFLPL